MSERPRWLTTNDQEEEEQEDERGERGLDEG
jgi:hypothetical protein